MRTLSCVPRLEGVTSVPSRATCNDRPLQWFVITPSGHSVYVESEHKGERLRRLYDEMGLGWCSLISEEGETIPF